MSPANDAADLPAPAIRLAVTEATAEPTAAERAFPIQRIGALVPRPAEDDYIYGVIPRDANIVLWGPPGAGKSFLVLSWLMAIAAGREWLGRATHAAPCLYVTTEGTRALSARRDAAASALSLADDLATLPLYLLTVPMDLMDLATVDTLLAAIRTQVPEESLGVVVIDTLAKNMLGDENNTPDMSAAMRGQDRLRQELGATVVLVHHSGWNEERERGNRALSGAQDLVFSVKQDADRRLTMSTSPGKTRDGENVTLTCYLLPTLDSVAVSDTPSYALTDRRALSPSELRTLRALPDPVFTARSFTAWREAAGLASSTFGDARKRLLELGYVEAIATGRVHHGRHQSDYAITAPGREVLVLADGR